MTTYKTIKGLLNHLNNLLYNLPLEYDWESNTQEMKTYFMGYLNALVDVRKLITPHDQEHR